MYMLIIWSFVSFPANSVIAAAPNVTTISGFGNLAGCTAAANSLAGNNGQTTGTGGGQLSVIAGCILVRSGQN